MDAKLKSIMLVMAMAFLLLVEIAALFIATYDTLYDKPVPTGASALISAGLTYAVTALGISHGTNAAIQGVQAQIDIKNPPPV